MTPNDITSALADLFGNTVQAQPPDSWQVESGQSRLLVLLSSDQSWLRALVSIAPMQEASPFLEQLLEANFDETQETRYAVYEGVLWGVYHHRFETLDVQDFKQAIARLVVLREKGLGEGFSKLAEAQIRQIISAAKQQGQTLEATMQTLERFYREGVMGEMAQTAEQRDALLEAWRYQLERFWNEVE